MLISDLDLAMTYIEVCEEVRKMCGVRREMPITLKWIDDEGMDDLLNFGLSCFSRKGKLIQK